MVITSKLFEAGLHCPTKCYRMGHDEQGDETTLVRWHAEQRNEYRQQGINQLVGGLQSQQVFTAEVDPHVVKAGGWRFGVGCWVSAGSCRSDLEAIEVSGARRQHVIPIRYVPHNGIGRQDKLLLAFDGLVLSRAFGRPIPTGRLVHGDHYVPLTVALSPLTKTVQTLLTNITESLTAPKAPPPMLGRRCTECEYHPECRRIAIEADDLSLLPGMTEKERKALGKRGIFTVTQLSYTFRPRRRPKQMASRPERYHHALKARAIREGKVHVIGQPELRVEGTPVYLDVEGRSEGDGYFLIGARVPTPSGVVQHSFWADSAGDEPQIWEDFLKLLSTLPEPKLLHYGSFEATFLRRMAARHGGPGTGPVALAITDPINLLSLLYGRVYFPTYSNGLKEQARFLGFEWTEPGARGLDALRWRAVWERTQDPVLKYKLLQYNADDCEALRRLTSFFAGLSSAAFGSTATDIVRADSLPRSRFHKWAQVDFRVPGLEEINRAAYWHYQRDRISVGRKTARRRIDIPRIRHRLPANRTISLPAVLSCPKCDSRRLYRNRTVSKTVLDVQFSRAGVRRSVTRYLFDSQRCPQCTSVFHNPDRPWTGEKFGPSLRSLAVYQNIELGMPLSMARQFLNEVLGLNLSRGAVHQFKVKAAEFYAETYRGILERLLTGNLIHADETRVNLDTGIGYVWVFTSLEEVAYVYAPTREGGLVQSLLKDFKGVLVSDFYTAYESVSCPQQRCLIHLIRDLNDDLVLEPFNAEMKGLVAEFAALLKPTISTVDRFGLKTRFLRKHRVQADRFFDRLGCRSYQTELAQKCQRRLLKNRHTLFTFCDYDGVPWNNNNAEHAIKALVSLRRQVSGLSSEKGMREYLTLFSLCESCRFKGVSFLEFVRSGKKDLQVFAEAVLKRRRCQGGRPRNLDLEWRNCVAARTLGGTPLPGS